MNSVLPYPTNGEYQRQYFEALYIDVIKYIIGKDINDQIIRSTVESCLQLFYTRIHHFKTFVFNDYEYWCNFISRSDAATEKFWRTIGRTLEKENDPDKRKAFSVGKKKFN